MPEGVFTITDIPKDKVELVAADYKMENPLKIETWEQPNGLWTVRATFAGEGKQTESYKG